MKVAYMIGSINRGGTETLILDVLKRAKELPFKCVFLHRHGGEMEDEFKKVEEVREYMLTPRHGNYIKYLFQLRKILKEESVDIVHAQFWLDCIYAKLATIFTDVPIILSFHGFFLKTGLQRVMTYISILFADQIIFVSDFEKKMYEDHYGKCLRKKSHVVYNGVDFNKIICRIDEQERDSECINICMIGSFGGVRNHEEMLKIVAQVKLRINKRINFYIVGGVAKNGKKIFETCLTEMEMIPDVFYMGVRNDVPDLLSKMDAYFYSTREDTFGISVVEAIASELPVLVNDNPVMKEITDNGELALLYETGNIEDGVQKAETLICNINDYKILSKKNAKKIREKFSIERHIHCLCNIYQLIKNKTYGK